VLLAGTDTSAITLEWAMAELLKHPAKMQKCVKELDEVVGRGRLVDESDLPNLPYLHAVVKETLRLHPPGALMVPHESTEDCTVSGYFIPAKTRVIVNVWAISRDPALWDQPFDFSPERFLPGQVSSHVVSSSCSR
jgi:cytochrome P450